MKNDAVRKSIKKRFEFSPISRDQLEEKKNQFSQFLNLIKMFELTLREKGDGVMGSKTLGS